MITSLTDIPLDIQNSINYDMIPEDAIAIHLEWGQLRGQEYYNRINDVTIYFDVNSWSGTPVLELIKRKGFDVWTIGKFHIPDHLMDDFWLKYKGVFSLTDSLKEWIISEIK